VSGPAPSDPMLEALCSTLGPVDALALREERAGILEYEGWMDRAVAEQLAGAPPCLAQPGRPEDRNARVGCPPLTCSPFPESGSHGVM
jgi:hypothetical protein